MGLKQKFINYKEKNLSTESITFKEQIGYAGGMLGHAMGQDCTNTYGEKFQRNFVGIDAKNMLIKDNIATIAGFFIPPIVGAFYDSLNSKRSNIKLGLRIAPIPFAIASILLFIVPSTSPLFNFIWVLFFGLLFSISESFYSIAMNVLALKLVQSPKDRKNFYTLSSLAASIGSMLPGWILPIAVDTTAFHNKQQWMYFFVALGFCFIGISFMYTPTRSIDMTRSIFFQPVKKYEPDETPPEKVHWNKKNVSLILHNRPFIIVQFALVCETIRKVTYDALPYLYDDVFAKYSMKSIIDPISGALSYVGLLLVPIIGTKVAAPKIAIGGYSYAAFFYLLISLFNVSGLHKGTRGLTGDLLHQTVLDSIRKNKWIIGVLIGFSGMPNAAQTAARNIVVADSTDYMEWYAEKKYGEPLRSDGLLLAAQGLVSKINEMIKKNLSNALFILTKYKESRPGDLKKPIQTPKTLRGIFNMVALCGLVGNLLAAICFMFDNYTGKRQKVIFEELTEFRKARESLEKEMKKENSAEDNSSTEE
ncbi:MAG: MFS transporter [Clostridiales bacterium]|nr:MFS transporter [Clostridiales bacterium]